MTLSRGWSIARGWGLGPLAQASVWLGVVMVASGCLSDRTELRETASPSASAEAPRLLTGPVSVLLTNQQDFTARVSFSENGSSAAAVKGNLFQQGGRVLFVPMASGELEPGRGTRGFRFLWDIRENRGYVVSEALRGYAAVDQPQHYSISAPPVRLAALAPEQIDEQPCRQEIISVSSNNGSQVEFRAWRALELNDLAIRIVSWPETNRVWVQLSEIRVEAQTPDLFTLPPAYQPYSSVQAMDRALLRKPRVMPYSEDSLRYWRRR